MTRNLELSQIEYHKYDAFSKSMAIRLLNTSPAHAIIPEPPTDEMQRGTILHALILGKGGERIAVAPQFYTEKKEPSDTWQSKQAKAFKADAKEKGLTPVLKGEYEELQKVANLLRDKIANAIRWHLQVEFSEGVTEEMYEWDDNGVKCKGMLDWRLNADIADLKISYTANPKDLAKIAYNQGWTVQDYAYSSLVERLNPDYKDRVSFTFIVCEATPPYSVVLATLDGTLKLIGEHKWIEARDVYRTCKETGDWPDYSAHKLVEAEYWMIKQNETAIMTPPEVIGGDYEQPDDQFTTEEF